MIDPKLLEGRSAKCSRCDATRPSSEALGWFEYKGPGCKAADEVCTHCHYFKVAHEPGHDRVDARTVMEKGLCTTGFEPHGPWALDSFWCGCGDTD